ncbi:MAG: tripartite tricarboxylate transporter substrate binding protein [Syntrophorhabdaceae bacterium]|nr:tripartite tricarboxylate transporter substrate binding protein [Syntrophorhabdaceae bacterium]
MDLTKGRVILTSLILFAFFACFLPTNHTFGQVNYPTKPINLLIGYAPGGVVDISERFMASKAEKFLGQPIVVTNNGGGGSSVAFGIVAKKPADGYNLVGGASTGLVRIPQFRSVPYTMDDFVPIMHFATPVLTPIVVKSTSPWKTFKELVEYAKKNPGKITYSTTGVGSPMHIAMEFVAKQEGISWTHIPYPGAVPAFTALLGGHVMVNAGAGESIPYIKDGTVRILANLSENRVKSWPNVPTLRELGYDIYNESVFLFAAPKGTPKPIIDKLDNAFRKAMDDPEFLSVMAKVEFEPSYRNSEDTRKYLEDAYKRIGRLIKELKIPMEETQKK